MKNKITKRMLLFRCGTIALLLLIAGLMFIVGRGHTVYFDNKKVSYDGKSIDTPPYRIDVYVNDERVAKLSAGDRGMCSWMGQDFRMRMEITKEKGGKKQIANVALKIPYNMDGIVLNLPALLAGFPQDGYLTEFVPAPAEVTAEDEEIVTDEFGLEGLDDGMEE
ncbi:MAG TPA: hypothetical protein DEV97_09295 [Lachnospiraceae bacterium]|nr:hypothetical protein [Lachnospiraceae bacterium]